MHVHEIWRYPVKSIGGERLEIARVGTLGIEHDRGWGIVDDDTGNVLTARREPALLMATATVVDDGPVIVTAAGDRLTTSAALSDWLCRPVTLTRADDEGGIYENPLDAEHDDDWVSWQGPGGAWHDSRRTRVSIVSTTTLGIDDVRRFRPNVVVDGAGPGDDDALVGHHVTIGEVEVSVGKQIDRCVMVTRPQPGLPRDLDVLRRVVRERDNCLGIGALVVTPGEIRIGDSVEPSLTPEAI